MFLSVFFERILKVAQALWGDRRTGVGSSALRELVEEAKAMEANVAAMQDRCAALQAVTEALQSELQNGLKPLANAALDGVEKLGASIVALHKASASNNNPPSMGMGIAGLLEATTPSLVTAKDQIALCKGQSTVVAERFRSLHKAAVNVLERASSVCPFRPIIKGSIYWKGMSEWGSTTYTGVAIY
jgi:hypothetical protein